MRSPLEAAQRRVTKAALDALGEDGFALAGSGAIREHGLIDRPTEDVDLFTSRVDAAAFDDALNRLLHALPSVGLTVTVRRRAPLFARLSVSLSTDGPQLELDLGVDWRERQPVILALGPTLSLEDAVGNKVAALFSRGEPRDYLDVDSIRSTGRFGDDELISAASERDPGFTLSIFIEQLEAATRIRDEDLQPYGTSTEQRQKMVERCLQWAERLRRE